MQIHDIKLTNNLQELTKHGSKSFPMAIYKTQMSLNVLGYVPLHWHEEIQFIYVLDGCVQIKISQNIYNINAGEGFFINSSRLHSAHTHDCNDSTYICFNINPSIIATDGSPMYAKYISPVLDSHRFSALIFREDIQWQNSILRLLIDIYHNYEDNDLGFELLIQSSLLRIWKLIIENTQDFFQSDEVDTEDKRIKDILTYIHDNYNAKISLDELARVASVSRPECCRFFKRMIHLTPFEYINNYRINQSIFLLKNTDMNVTEIANEVGFGSISYFIERFRKYTNYTPREFKRRFILDRRKGGVSK